MIRYKNHYHLKSINIYQHFEGDAIPLAKAEKPSENKPNKEITAEERLNSEKALKQLTESIRSMQGTFLNIPPAQREEFLNRFKTSIVTGIQKLAQPESSLSPASSGRLESNTRQEFDALLKEAQESIKQFNEKTERDNTENQVTSGLSNFAKLNKRSASDKESPGIDSQIKSILDHDEYYRNITGITAIYKTYKDIQEIKGFLQQDNNLDPAQKKEIQSKIERQEKALYIRALIVTGNIQASTLGAIGEGGSLLSKTLQPVLNKPEAYWSVVQRMVDGSPGMQKVLQQLVSSEQAFATSSKIAGHAFIGLAIADIVLTQYNHEQQVKMLDAYITALKTDKTADNQQMREFLDQRTIVQLDRDIQVDFLQQRQKTELDLHKSDLTIKVIGLGTMIQLMAGGAGASAVGLTGIAIIPAALMLHSAAGAAKDWNEKQTPQYLQSLSTRQILELWIDARNPTYSQALFAYLTNPSDTILNSSEKNTAFITEQNNKVLDSILKAYCERIFPNNEIARTTLGKYLKLRHGNHASFETIEEMRFYSKEAAEVAAALTYKDRYRDVYNHYEKDSPESPFVKLYKMIDQDKLRDIADPAVPSEKSLNTETMTAVSTYMELHRHASLYITPKPNREVIYIPATTTSQNLVLKIVQAYFDSKNILSDNDLYWEKLLDQRDSEGKQIINSNMIRINFAEGNNIEGIGNWFRNNQYDSILLCAPYDWKSLIYKAKEQLDQELHTKAKKT